MMEFKETKKYCNTIDEAWHLLNNLPFVEAGTLPEWEELEAIERRLLMLSAGKDVLPEIASNENLEITLPMYREVCSYALSSQNIIVMSAEEYEQLKYAVPTGSLADFQKRLSTALNGVECIVNRLQKENGSDEFFIKRYLMMCYDLQLVIKDKALQLGDVFRQIAELTKCEGNDDEEEPLPKELIDGLQLMLVKGWLTKKNGKYNWILKKPKVMLGYIVGELLGIECHKLWDERGSPAVFKTDKIFPQNRINAMFGNVNPGDAYNNLTTIQRDKRPKWKSDADNLIKEVRAL